MRITRAHITEISIYTALTLAGVAIDLGVANALVYLLAWPLIVAGIFGLIAGTITNYFIHLKVTFKNRNLTSSWKSFGKYVQTCLIGASVRLGALAILGFSLLSPLTCLIIATALSFSVNYALSRFYTFKPSNK